MADTKKIVMVVNEKLEIGENLHRIKLTKPNGQSSTIEVQIKHDKIITDINSQVSIGDVLSSVPISATETKDHLLVEKLGINPNNPIQVIINHGLLFVGNHNQNWAVNNVAITINDFLPLFQNLKSHINQIIPQEKIQELTTKVEELEKTTNKNDLISKFVKFKDEIAPFITILSPYIEPITKLIREWL